MKQLLHYLAYIQMSIITMTVVPKLYSNIDVNCKIKLFFSPSKCGKQWYLWDGYVLLWILFTDMHAYTHILKHTYFLSIHVYTKHNITTVKNCVSPVGWGCRIHRLHLCKEVRPPFANECPRYATELYDGESAVMLEFWGMWSTSLSLLPGPLWPRVVAPDWVLWVKYNCLTFKICPNKWLT